MRKKSTVLGWTDGSFGRRGRRVHGVDDNFSLFFVQTILSVMGAHTRDLRTAHAGVGGFPSLWFVAGVATGFLCHFFVPTCPRGISGASRK